MSGSESAPSDERVVDLDEIRSLGQHRLRSIARHHEQLRAALRGVAQVVVPVVSGPAERHERPARAATARVSVTIPLAARAPSLANAQDRPADVAAAAPHAVKGAWFGGTGVAIR